MMSFICVSSLVSCIKVKLIIIIYTTSQYFFAVIYLHRKSAPDRLFFVLLMFHEKIWEFNDTNRSFGWTDGWQTDEHMDWWVHGWMDGWTMTMKTIYILSWEHVHELIRLSFWPRQKIEAVSHITSNLHLIFGCVLAISLYVVNHFFAIITAT